MRVLTWAIRLALFVLLLAFAARNTDPVALRFYFDLEWRAPLVALLLAFFAAGALLGLLAALGTVLRQRRRIADLEGHGDPLRAAEIKAAAPPPAAEG